jgi:hypothetical protein
MENAIDFKDRKGLLSFFGVLFLLMGLLSLLVFIVAIVSVSVMPDAVQQSQQESMASVFVGLAIYLAVAAVFITLGIGSIKTTRWARSLTLLLSWITFITGIYVLVFFIFWGSGMFEQIGSNAQNANVAFFAKVILYAFTIFFLIILPGVFILFYRRDDVIKTVEQYDPKERWTDSRPLPILAISFLFIYTFFMPFFYIAYGFVAPFFGVFLSGVPAAILLFANSAISLYLALEVYRMKSQAWYYTIYLSLFWIVSFLITLLFNDFIDIYTPMNLPESQIALIEKMGIFSNFGVFSMTLLYFIPYLGFLWYTKKYFTR